MATNQLWQQSEVVRTKLFPKWFERDFNVLTDFFEKGEEQQVGERDFRIPFELTPGGRVGRYDPQLGDMGRGSSPTGNVMLQSYFNYRINFEFDHLQIAATENKKIAVQSPFMECVAKGVKEMHLQWDKQIHNDGTAALAYATAYSNTGGTTTYTCSNAFGTQLLRIGQFYTIYDSSQTVLKSAGVAWATQINTQLHQVTLSIIVPNAAANDIIMLDGVSGPNPVGPRGLKYWISNAATGYTAGINRATTNQIISKQADGTNGLTVEAVMALHDRIMNDRGEVGNLIGIAALAQRAYAFTQMLAIQQTFLNQGQANAVDRLPKLKGKEFFMWGGVPHYLDIHQDQTVVAYIIPELFGRARLRKEGFFETPGKSGADARFFPLSGASGGPAAGVWFGFTRDEDLYCLDPGSCGLINNLPTGAYYA